MTIKVQVERQPPLVALIEIDNVDLATGVVTPIFDLPPNAVVIAGGAQVITAAVAGTSSVLDVGYDLPTGTDDPDAFVTALALTGAANSNETVQDNKATGIFAFPIGAKVTVTRTLVGADTTPGRSRVWIEYIVKDRSREIQI